MRWTTATWWDTPAFTAWGRSPWWFPWMEQGPRLRSVIIPVHHKPPILRKFDILGARLPLICHTVRPNSVCRRYQQRIESLDSYCCEIYGRPFFVFWFTSALNTITTEWPCTVGTNCSPLYWASLRTEVVICVIVLVLIVFRYTYHVSESKGFDEKRAHLENTLTSSQHHRWATEKIARSLLCL